MWDRRGGRGEAILRRSRQSVAPAALAGVVGGLAAWAVGAPEVADGLWAATTALLLVPLTVSVVRSLLRGDVGVDAIALVSMAGALALGEYLAGAVVALMLAGGNALEEWANRRAARELTALIERAPRSALVRRGDGLVEVPVEVVVPGDRVVVRAGEVVPVDGMVESDEAIVDESALTGEPLPVTIGRGGQVRSGTACAGTAFELTVLRPAAESTYAALVRLVEAAGSERAPFVRLADRYAAFFLPVTVVVAGVAWAISGDPVRALAVFVVATPCPLILAAPIALISGLSRCARGGVVVKGAATIEQLGKARSVLLDKTGTVTLGRPQLVGCCRWTGSRRRRRCGSRRASIGSRRIRSRRRSSPAPRRTGFGSRFRAMSSSRSGAGSRETSAATMCSSAAGGGLPSMASRRCCRNRWTATRRCWSPSTVLPPGSR